MVFYTCKNILLKYASEIKTRLVNPYIYCILYQLFEFIKYYLS